MQPAEAADASNAWARPCEQIDGADGGDSLLTAFKIDVWTFRIDVQDHVAVALSAFLSHEERERADRFVRPHDALRYRAGRGRLRELLARYTATPPQDLTLGSGPNGKPYVAVPPVRLHFNLTHSDGLAALAVSPDAEVGLDIERIEPLREGGLEGNFSRREQAALAQLSGEDRLTAFYRCWTRKEAIVKAHGAGLDIPLDAFDVPIDGNETAFAVTLALSSNGASQSWHVVPFTPAPGYAGALAIAGRASDTLDIRWRAWPETR